MKTLAPVLTVLLVAVVGTGVAGAATGGELLLGRSNAAGTTTVLSSSKGAPLDLRAPAGSRPFSVNSRIVVPHLNADRVDGLDAAQLQRRLTGSCPAGTALSGVGADGRPACVALEPAGVLQTHAVHGTTTSQVVIAYRESAFGVSVARVGSACALRVSDLGAYPFAVDTSTPLTRILVEPDASTTTAASTTQLQTIAWTGGTATVFLTWLPASSSCAYQGTATW